MAIFNIERVVWDEWNTTHIAKHQVICSEVEEALHGKFVVRPSYRERVTIIGKTKDNRSITIIAHEDEKDVYYIITARDSNEEEKDLYEKEN